MNLEHDFKLLYADAPGMHPIEQCQRPGCGVRRCAPCGEWASATSFWDFTPLPCVEVDVRAPARAEVGA